MRADRFADPRDLIGKVALAHVQEAAQSLVVAITCEAISALGPLSRVH